MFESLKKKLTGWLGIGSKVEEKPKKVEKKVKEKPKVKEKKPEKEVKKEKNSEKEEKKEVSNKVVKQKKEKKAPTTIEKEREVSAEVIKDIKKEHPNEEIIAVPQLEKSDLEPKEIEETVKVEQEIKEEEKPKGFFSKLFTKVTNKISASYKITNEDFEENFQELEIILLENNVALEVVDKIKSSLEKSLVNQEVKKTDLGEKIISALKAAILSVLIEPPNLIEQIKSSKEPYIILFFGINGSGKTTSIAKLAYKLKQNNISCVLAAGDTFRAASIEQLKTHADRLSVPIVASTYGSDPASVAFDAIAYAKAHHIKAVLIDTAGRMYTKSNLLKEMEKIIRISKPNLKIFVGESITGNDATEQAKTFNETCGIDGIILSKADVDDKAGTILSVSHVTGKPIYFLGVGQEYNDLEVFSKKTVIKNLGLD
jgi:fused signal recognition particle receptor